MQTRALTMLNKNGDTTIAWTPDRDDEMETIIKKKMSEGCSFFIIDPRFGTREKLSAPAHANRHRVLAIPDEDLAKFVGAPAGTAVAVASPAAPARVVRKARTAREVATSESVGVQPRGGG